MPAQHITDLESSFLPTPTVSDTYTGNLSSTQQKEGSLHSVTLAQIVNRPDLLPTPTTQETSGSCRDHGGDLLHAVRCGCERKERKLLPTPLVDDSKNNGQNTNRIKTLTSEVYKTEKEQNWGKFETAILQWEKVLGRKAPYPTKADAKDGSHRLSSEFTEWLMGVPEGWITNCGLSRSEEIKACGNGVVPQQAELAIKQLIERINNGHS
jgi:DNA (cytosine-5)-methyltransferase 1